MITLLLGRSGSGKTGRVIDAIAENARRGETGQLLIVPPQFTHGIERRLCSQAGNGACLFAEALSFERLCQRVFAHGGGAARKTLDLPGRLLLMRLALKSVEDKLEVYSGLSRPHSLRAALDMADELKGCGLSPADMERAAAAAASGSLGRKLRDAALICAAYDALLSAGLSDRQEDMARMCRELRQGDFARGRRVYVDGFTWFTGLEQRALEALAAGGAELTVSVTWDEDDEAFLLQRRAVGAVRRIARAAGQELRLVFAEQKGGKSADLEYLEKKFFAQSREKFPGAAENIELYTAEDAFAQCRLAAAKAVWLVREKGLRWRDIVVACRGMESWAPVLERVFAWEGAPLFVSGSVSFAQKPEAAFLLSALEAAESGFEQEDVIAMLKTGLASLEPEELDVLENYARLWELRGHFWTRDEPWAFHPGGFAMEADESSDRELEKINALRRRVQLPLSALAGAARRTDRAQAHAQALYGFFVDSGFPDRLERRRRELEEAGRLAQAGECAQLWGVVCGVLDESVDILGDSPLAFGEYSRLLRLMLSACSVSTIPPSLDCVTASDISLLGQTDIKALILIGAEDGALPAVTEPPGLFTESERRGLAALDVELGGASERLAEAEMSYIYSVLAKPKLHITVARSAGEGAAPSFVFTRLAELFSLEPKEFSRWQELAGAMTAAGVRRAALSGGPGAENARAALEKAEEAGRPAAERAAAENAGAAPESIGPAAGTLYGGELFLTPSRVERFALCPFSFFMEYGLKARPERAAAFDAPEIGVFTHYLLENTVRDVSAQGGFKAVPPEEVRSLSEKYTDLFITRRLDSFRDKSPRFRHLFLRQARASRQVVCDMAAELAVSDFSPEMFELRFGLAGDEGLSIAPVSLSGGGVSLSVAGVADRVDVWRHDGAAWLRVVDYKTGVREFRLSDLSYGLNLQLLIYLFALARRGPELFGAPARPAGALYCPAHLAEADSGNSLSDPDAAEAARRTGLVLGDRDVISAMERGIEGRAKFLPVKAEGEAYSGSLASERQLELLEKLVEEVLLSLGGRIAAGEIAPVPRISGQRDPCRWCRYGSACGVDAADPARGRRLPKKADGDFWRELEEKYAPASAGDAGPGHGPENGGREALHG